MRAVQTRLIRAFAVIYFLSTVIAGKVDAAGADRLEIPAELWDRPRSGRVVMAVPAVRAAVGSLLDRSATRLEIRHPPGPEPTLQAEELRAWLTAHAVEPRRIQLRADLPARQPLLLEIVN